MITDQATGIADTARHLAGEEVTCEDLLPYLRQRGCVVPGVPGELLLKTPTVRRESRLRSDGRRPSQGRKRQESEVWAHTDLSGFLYFSTLRANQDPILANADPPRRLPIVSGGTCLDIESHTAHFARARGTLPAMVERNRHGLCRTLRDTSCAPRC